MVVKVAATARLQWSNPNLPKSPSSSRSLASAISSYSLPKRCRSDAAIILKSVFPKLNRSALFVSPSPIIQRSRSSEFLKPKSRTLTKACSASFDDFSDEEFSKRIEEIFLRFQLSDDDDDDDEETNNANNMCSSDSETDYLKFDERSSWLDRGESAYCSMKKAFSSMVFIIRELHSYTLQMREFLFYEDLQGILVRVKNDMHASFVWLFQQVFSHTPTLMIYVMLLLANYSVYSMGNTVNPIAGSYVPLVEVQDQKHSMFDSSICGNKGGSGDKVTPIDGDDEWFDKTESTVKIDDYLSTELVYRKGLLEEPNNPLLLANYAQFIYLINHDYERAEELFKKAIEVKPADGEAYSKYAKFLWKAKKDLWGAEEKFLGAIDADPSNSCYIANYAYFLWNTGAEDTCL